MSVTRFLRRLSNREPEARNEDGGESLTGYIRRVNPRFSFYRHTQAIIAALEMVMAGQISDLMVWIPPGTGKSEVISRLAASYWITRHPTETVGVVSYGVELAQEMTRDAREYYAEAGGQFDPSQRAKTRWKTTKGGGMWGRGFGGSVRGMRYHLGIVDDPHKGIETLNSPLEVARLQRWWDNTWMNRGHLYSDRPIARVVVMQRLAENDLCGWLLTRPDAAKWSILALDAIHSEEPFEITPSGARFLPDWRKPGELLCPERLPLSELEKQRGNPDGYSAQYDQRPVPTSDLVLDRAKFNRIGQMNVPLMLSRVVGVDLAARKTQLADFTVAICLGYGVDGRYYLFRPWREKKESPDLRREIPLYCRKHYAQNVAVESNAFQLSMVQELRRDPAMAGYQISEALTDADKVARARAWEHILRQELIYLVDDGSDWIEVFLDEVKNFPRTGVDLHDDQIDAVSIAFQALRQLTVFGAAAG